MVSVYHLQPVIFGSMHINGLGDSLDLSIVVAESNRGWILDRIAKEIANECRGKVKIVYWPCHVPNSRVVLFMHYSLIHHSNIRKNSNIRRAIWFTHQPEKWLEKIHMYRCLLRSDLIISMSSSQIPKFLRKLFRRRFVIEIPGVDTVTSLRKERGNGKIGFCSAYYPRKNPELMFEIVRGMPEEQFLLLGQGWENYKFWNEFLKLENFTYLSPSYSDYSKHYSSMDVFLSTSTKEGGPVPLLEAMAHNVYPIVTDTGFARDIFGISNDRERGTLLPVNATSTDFITAIKANRQIDTDVSQSVRHLTWERCARASIDHLFGRN
jgi:glycosyltransferase involved in cell wall biosynthesis